MLLHGFPQDATAWTAVEPGAAPAGLRTLALDQRGHSPMARPRGRRHYRLRETAGDVLALLDAAGPRERARRRPRLGGMVAWALGAWHPDRVRTLTALSAPHPAALTTAMTTSDQALRSYYMALFQLPLLPERLLLSGGGAPLRRMLRGGGLSEEAAAHYVARMREPGALSAALGWYRALPVRRAATRWAGSGCRRCTSGAPATPSSAGPRTEATARFVDAPYRLEVLDDVTHWIPELAADRVAELVTAHVRTA